MKKTEVITFRTDEATYAKITTIARQKDWTVAKVVDKICKEYFKAAAQEVAE